VLLREFVAELLRVAVVQCVEQLVGFFE